MNLIHHVSTGRREDEMREDERREEKRIKEDERREEEKRRSKSHSPLLLPGHTVSAQSGSAHDS
jgi:hypothetical protein